MTARISAVDAAREWLAHLAAGRDRTAWGLLDRGYIAELVDAFLAVEAPKGLEPRARDQLVGLIADAEPGDLYWPLAKAWLDARTAALAERVAAAGGPWGWVQEPRMLDHDLAMALYVKMPDLNLPFSLVPAARFLMRLDAHEWRLAGVDLDVPSPSTVY